MVSTNILYEARAGMTRPADEPRAIVELLRRIF
jgi:hypothetical protein